MHLRHCRRIHLFFQSLDIIGIVLVELFRIMELLFAGAKVEFILFCCIILGNLLFCRF